MNTRTRYIGGPFDGGANPDDFIDEIEMRTPAGCGRYVREEDESGRPVYRWEPEVTAGGPATRA
ncbi:hypothetical protein HHL19_35660 [Streptomyces sp. R302]|uniref:hypothetical protein n=1 Tax=unclassified Streptomyces TaxID=2593676 RepID=UPI00145C7DD3|nr:MULTISPECIES: hypothetical protein [unclassified Streptomyces]NML55123.1 hypothetical protein [Streptomyces sp. R301]NML83847.1 hypothetical protein [Streptomyces sp. R302]